MAREAYLHGKDTEPSIHDNVITLNTKKEKFQNWWHYNKIIVIVVAIVLVAIIMQVVSVLTRVEPDYTIAFASEKFVDEDMIKLLEKELAAYGVDRNEDGDVVVDVVCYFLTNNPDYSENLEAATVQLSSDLTLGTSMIWLIDDNGYAYLDPDDDGALFYEVYDAPDTKVMKATDIEAFTELDVSSYSYSYDKDADVDTEALIDAVFGDLDTVLRVVDGTSIEKEETLEELDYHVEFMKNLVSNTKVSE